MIITINLETMVAVWVDGDKFLSAPLHETGDEKILVFSTNDGEES